MNARTTPPAYDPAWGFEVAPPPAANLAAVDISGIFQPQLQPQPPRLIGQPSVASVQSVASFGGLPYASSVAQPSVASVDTSEQSFGGLPYASSVATASLASGVSSPGRECVLCLSAPRTIRLEPCGHGCLCEECLKRLSENGSPSCPICMAPIAGYHQGVVGREATFVPASSAARQGPLTRLNTARLQARESMLQPVRRMFSGEERPSWFALLFFFLIIGAYIALWALPIISIAGIESYASSIEEARCHAVVVGCSMTCGNTIRQVDKNDENSHEVQSPCKDCRGEQLRAAGASLSERCEWAAPLMPVLKEAQCGSNYTLRVAVKVEGEGSASAEQTNQVLHAVDASGAASGGGEWERVGKGKAAGRREENGDREMG
jgi:hypothetical protein